jgi:galactokinase
MSNKPMNETELIQRFTAHYSAPPTLIARSPGRVNLIGEHTDYNDGYVFPAALDMGTLVLARPRSDGQLRTLALRLQAEDEISLADLRPQQGPEWTRYVRGMAAVLREAGCPMAGADLLIDSNLPLGAGLSSSASVEMGVAVALMALGGFDIGRKALARLGQRVENEIVGVQSGIMDQLAVACGVADHALLIDCRTLSAEPVPIPPGVRILVLDTDAPRTLAGSAYNVRRAQCESALAKLRVAKPELVALRDVTSALLIIEGKRLDEVELKRARHVVSENERVLASVAALRAGNVQRFGQLMNESHNSLRDDYEVSGPELDTMVELARATPGVLGARLTGAGFGGCCVALVTAEQASAAAASITERYRAATGRAGKTYVSALSQGAHVRVLA